MWTEDALAETAGEVAAIHMLAMGYVVDSPESLQAAAQELNTVHKLRRQVEEARKRITRPLDDAKAEVMKQARQQTGPLEEAENALKAAIAAYQDAQRQKRAEAERQAREAYAVRCETGSLEDTLDAAVSLMAALPEAPSPVPGIAQRETWHVEVIDEMALLRAVLEGTVPPGAVKPDMQMLAQSARAMRGALKWPGVRVWRETNVAARGR